MRQECACLYLGCGSVVVLSDGRGESAVAIIRTNAFPAFPQLSVSPNGRGPKNVPKPFTAVVTSQLTQGKGEATLNQIFSVE